MQTTLQTNHVRVQYELLGRETGGFHDKYTDTATANRNLTKLGNAFGNDTSTLMLTQGGMRIVDAIPGLPRAECDVLVTTSVGHNLMMRPADCVPVLIYSNSRPMLALVHASRTSLEAGIIENTIKKLAFMGVEQSDIVIHICPGIAQEVYVLPLNIMDELHQLSWKNNIRITDETVAISLSGFVETELLRIGIAKHRITTSKINTADGNEYFSHFRATRNNEENGRNGFVCAIEAVHAELDSRKS